MPIFFYSYTNYFIYIHKTLRSRFRDIWSDLEKGIKDPQLSTLWRVAEGLNIPLSKLIKEIETKLTQDFSFIEQT